MFDPMVTLIRPPQEFNYVAAFLTLSCNYKCSYCINHPGIECLPRGLLGAEAWVSYLNRLDLPDDTPITFQGGEPSLHHEFMEILQGVRDGLHLDILTNLSFDVEKFSRKIPAQRFMRTAPYSAIRVTYHPGQADLEELLKKVLFLQEKGYPIGLYSIRIPGTERLIENLRKRTAVLGIDYRTKEFLGIWRGKVWGTFHYDDGVSAKNLKSCHCRGSELLIAPDGAVFRCHRDLYLKENRVGDIQNGDFQPEYRFRECSKFGECNPCDLKKKTNRLQVDGHASVEIRFP